MPSRRASVSLAAGQVINNVLTDSLRLVPQEWAGATIAIACTGEDITVTAAVGGMEVIELADCAAATDPVSPVLPDDLFVANVPALGGDPVRLSARNTNTSAAKTLYYFVQMDEVA